MSTIGKYQLNNPKRSINTLKTIDVIVIEIGVNKGT